MRGKWNTKVIWCGDDYIPLSECQERLIFGHDLDCQISHRACSVLRHNEFISVHSDVQIRAACNDQHLFAVLESVRDGPADMGLAKLVVAQNE